MQKLTCTLEFKEGRPVAKTINESPKCECKLFSKEFEECPNINKSVTSCSVFESFQTAENNRRGFEISEDLKHIGSDEIYIPSLSISYSMGFLKANNIQKKFTATIENNIVTKIELL